RSSPPPPSPPAGVAAPAPRRRAPPPRELAEERLRGLGSELYPELRELRGTADQSLQTAASEPCIHLDRVGQRLDREQLRRGARQHIHARKCQSGHLGAQCLEATRQRRL